MDTVAFDCMLQKLKRSKPAQQLRDFSQKDALSTTNEEEDSVSKREGSPDWSEFEGCFAEGM